tara:strand:- start:14202 stop:14495 length:294 start_codon:yes stop_codon:yes gene_type:complete
MSTILTQPEKPINIPVSSQWLAGQGAGSWFWIGATESTFNFQIKRFSPLGVLECDTVMIANMEGFITTKPYQFTYLSHCSFCTIIQDSHTFTFSCNT